MNEKIKQEPGMIGDLDKLVHVHKTRDWAHEYKMDILKLESKVLKPKVLMIKTDDHKLTENVVKMMFKRAINKKGVENE